jgi:hypothetical protein
MNTPAGWELDISIQEDGSIVRYNHMIKINLGPWHASKPCDHMLTWCLEHVGTHNRNWRAYRADFGGTLIIQFVNASDATLFALTWSES